MTILPVRKIQRAHSSACFCKYERPRRTRFWKRQSNKAVRRAVA